MSHTDKDVRKFLKKAQKVGWGVEIRENGHLWGYLRCGSGCVHQIKSTPRGPAGDQAKILRDKAAKCDHLPPIG